MTLNSGQKTLLTLFGMTLFPILAAQALFSFWRPDQTHSYGTLLAQPAAVPANGFWRLVAADPQGCTAQQRDLIFATRQMRLAQGQEARRMQRASTATCANLEPDVALLAPHNMFPQAGLYLIDPQGNLVMHYQPGQIADNDGRKKAMAEIGRVLKNNEGIG